MKKILFILTIAVLVISVSSCGNKKKKAEEKAGTHTHEDGTVHGDDAHNAKPNQEAFEVDADNDAEHENGDADTDGHTHDHGDTDAHDHEHGEHN